MSFAPTNLGTSGTVQPGWGWSGVSKLASCSEAHFEHVVAMLPAAESSDEKIAAELVGLCAHFHGWLHQDEFGPSRGKQTAALRAHIKLVRELCRQLRKGTSLSRGRLDAALRNSNDGLSPVVAVLGDAAADVESDLQNKGASNQDIGWFSRVRSCAGTLFTQIETTNYYCGLIVRRVVSAAFCTMDQDDRSSVFQAATCRC
jgi:hypothetical protein